MAIVTRNGEAFGCRGQPLKFYENNCGYVRVFHNGRKVSLHRLVAEAFLPNPQGKPHVNHKDGNKKNCAAKNLEWVTQSENEKHAFKTGLKKPHGSYCPGESNGRAKLSLSQVKEIRIAFSTRKRGEKSWLKYGISQVMYYNIARRRNWL